MITYDVAMVSRSSKMVSTALNVGLRSLVQRSAIGVTISAIVDIATIESKPNRCQSQNKNVVVGIGEPGAERESALISDTHCRRRCVKD